jgi:ATP-dependent RNA helicase A
MCMHSTMVTPIHLLLFGARKVEYMDSLVVLDDWFVINKYIIYCYCNTMW